MDGIFGRDKDDGPPETDRVSLDDEHALQREGLEDPTLMQRIAAARASLPSDVRATAAAVPLVDIHRARLQELIATAERAKRALAEHSVIANGLSDNVRLHARQAQQIANKDLPVGFRGTTVITCVEELAVRIDQTARANADAMDALRKIAEAVEALAVQVSVLRAPDADAPPAYNSVSRRLADN